MDSAYVLHRRRYRESSLIVEFLTREQGRIAAVAKGALRPKSPLSGVLQPLMPLKLQVRGRNELMNLTHAEAAGMALGVEGERLYSVFYINELIIRLTVVHDPNPKLFELYERTLSALASAAPLEANLREFERELLELSGLGMNLTVCTDDGQAVEADKEYDFVADLGPARASLNGIGKRVGGQTLLALAGQRAWTDDDSHAAKQLMRYVINHHLDGRPLAARELFAASSPRKS